MATESISEQQLPSYIETLLKPEFYSSELSDAQYTVSDCQLLETHISWVILTGRYAYKVKKPVNFGFLDFSTLEKREFYCQEELRLNQRIAPELYIRVLKLTEHQGNWAFNGEGKVVDFVLQMHQFPQTSRFDLLMSENQINFQHIHNTAAMLARFHHSCETAAETSDYGNPAQVFQPVLENFLQIDASVLEQNSRACLKAIQHWSETTFNNLISLLKQRKAEGFIRECHGDLHLSNLAWLNDQALAYDCLEFNSDLRWIDVISDIAFLVMDCQRCQKNELAQALLNNYLEYTGDYTGLKILSFYLCYRAVVMTKVEFLRLQQLPSSHPDYPQFSQDFNRYLQLAHQYTQRRPVALMINHGLSASGKTTISRELAYHLPAIKISSDIERKRLAGLWPEWIKQGSNNENHLLYSQSIDQQTYNQLLTQAEIILNAGYSVIVDATFLNIEFRSKFYSLALENRLPFIILNYKVPNHLLRERIQGRNQGVSDADLQVLEKQISLFQPLKDYEQEHKLDIETQKLVDTKQLSVKVFRLIMNFKSSK